MDLTALYVFRRYPHLPFQQASNLHFSASFQCESGKSILKDSCGRTSCVVKPPVGPSQRAKSKAKREHARLGVHKRSAGYLQCAAPETACLIDGGIGGYECVDTQSHLESCGGCLGEGGVDCTQISESVVEPCSYDREHFAHVFLLQRERPASDALPAAVSFSRARTNTPSTPTARAAPSKCCIEQTTVLSEVSSTFGRIRRSACPGFFILSFVHCHLSSALTRHTPVASDDRRSHEDTDRVDS